jgi:hypothetical protein
VVLVVTSKGPSDAGCQVAPFEFLDFCFQGHDFTFALLVAHAHAIVVVGELDFVLEFLIFSFGLIH